MLKPLSDQIIVIIDEEPEKTEFGILLTQKQFQPLPKTGVVYAVGPGKIHPAIKIGAQVAFHEDRPVGFKYDDKKLLKLHKDQILAIFERTK